MNFIKVSSQWEAPVSSDSNESRDEVVTKPAGNSEFRPAGSSGQTNICSYFPRENTHRAVCTLHVVNPTRGWVSRTLLLPGAHETRNAANVYRLARQRRVYATPNTGNHSGQPVWGTFVETTYSYLLSSSLAVPPLLSVFLSSGCAWIRVCSVTTEDWNKRELLFLEFAPSSILEFTSFCPFDFGVTDIRGHLRRLFPCFPSVWNRRTICCAWNISLSDTKVSLRWYHSSLPVICCNFYSRINLDDYVSI